MTVRYAKINRAYDHNPSFDVADIVLNDKVYLVHGHHVEDGGDEITAETEDGLVIPVTEQMKRVNAAKVVKAGPKCELAKEGDFIVTMSVAGERFYHLLPQPCIRDFFDDANLFLIEEKYVLAKISPAKTASPVKEKKTDGKEACDRGGD